MWFGTAERTSDGSNDSIARTTSGTAATASAAVYTLSWCSVPEEARHCPGRQQVGRVAQPNREGLQPRAALGQVALRDRRHDARVEAAAQEDADGHVAHHLTLDRPDENLARVTSGGGRHGRGEPHETALRRPVVPRREHLDVALPVAVERRHLRREPHAPPAPGPVERLDTDRVARREEALARPGEDEGEHPAELVERVGPVLIDQVEGDLVVRRRPKARVGEPTADRLVVVDLAVADEPQIAGRAERLRAALDVDDRQAPVPEPRVVADRHAALVVGAAVHEAREHAAPGVRVDRAVLGGDSAHDGGFTGWARRPASAGGWAVP
jgi:hypothetical protein